MRFYTSVTRKGANILYRGYDGTRRVTKKVPFEPTLYVKTDKETKTKSIFGDNVLPQKFENMYEASKFKKSFADIAEYPIFGTDDWIGQYIQEQWPEEIEFDESKINIASIDIEVYSPSEFPKPEDAKHPIDAITLHSTADDMYHVWTYREYDRHKTELDIPPSQIDHRHFDNENDLLLDFLEFWTSPFYMPDVVTGFYSRGFDIPYIVNRYINLFGERVAKTLSPWNDIEKKTVMLKTGMMQTVELKGIAQLDFLDIFKKFGYKYGVQESYKLNHIAYVVLGEKKLSYEEFSGLWDLAEKNPQKYVDYNIKDTQLVVKMVEKTKLISLVFAMAYKAGVNFSDTLGTTRIWDTIIMRDLKKRDIVVQPFEPGFAENYGGGWVKEPNPGMYDWITTFDLNSLYPNIIVQYNMSPETIVEGERLPLTVQRCLDGHDEVSDHCIAANGVLYRKDKQGCLPRIIEAYYAERKEVQAELKKLEIQYDASPDKKVKVIIDRLYNQQMSIKILMNSLYGALGSRFFRHYDIRTAEAITTTGQLTIMLAERAVNGFLNSALRKNLVSDKDYVIAIDTDSIMVDLSDVVEHAKPDDPTDYLAKFADTVVEPVLNAAFDKLLVHQNGFKNRMVMGREVIASRGFWRAKKHYAMLITDDEGVRLQTPKVKIKGLQAIQSSTPEMQRNWMKEAIRLMLATDADTARKYIDECREEFFGMAPEQIGKPSGVSDVNKYLRNGKCVKGTPYNSRAAINYNLAIKEHGIDNKYQAISNGDKMKIIRLKMPNPIKQNLIGFPEVLPRELGLNDYIDYQTQFDKTFENAMTSMFEAVGWNIHNVSTLDSFF